MDPRPDLDSLLARLDALRAEVDAMRPLTDEQVGRAMQRLRLEWTYHSNAIEGNSLTYGETRALLMHGVTAQGKPLKDHLDIERHSEVVRYIEAVVRSDAPIRVDLATEIHLRLMGETYEITAETPDGDRVRRTCRGGVYKEHPNNVRTQTGETHYYALPLEVPGRMAELFAWMASPEAADLHPVARAAVVHHRVVEIHPFPDGNGRTARMLMNLLLMRDGYVPAVLRQENRPAYYGALSEADGGDSQGIIQFVAEELAETTELYLRALKREPDPSAFERRAALLHQKVASAVEQSGNRTRDRAKAAGERVVSPLGRTIGQGIRKLAGVFDREEFDAEVVFADASSEKGRGAWLALHRRGWRHTKAVWSLHEHLMDPGTSIEIALIGSAGKESVEVKVSLNRETLVDVVYGYERLPDESEIEHVAHDFLDRLIERVEAVTSEADE
ncbi:MAG: Fic family protein [Bacteroidota bacterium]